MTAGQDGGQAIKITIKSMIMNTIEYKLETDLYRRGDGRLALKHKNEAGEDADTPVQVVCAFPWTNPREYISIRDDKGRELVLIEEMKDLKEPVKKIIEEELARWSFLPRIIRIEAVTSEMELFRWKVETDSGPRDFMTHRHEYPRSLPGGQILLKDVANDLYLIENPKQLDPKSRKILWAHVD